MRLPVIQGIIERRILVNYRVDPAVLNGLLPRPFRPRIVRGFGMVGICLIRLGRMRPRLMPAWLGISSENAAHRVAVEFENGDATKEGVYIRRRDTSSWFNAVTGGRIFPGVHHHARFRVHETPERYEISIVSDDRATQIDVRGHVAPQLPARSIFRSLREASDFFRAGSLGYSPAHDGTRFQGLELHCAEWCVTPLEVESVTSSFFDDPEIFPAGSIEFDCALLMRDIQHEWHGKTDLCCPVSPRPRLATEASRV